MAISVVSFTFSRTAQPDTREPSFLLSAGFLYHLLSPTCLVSKLTDFLSSPSYVIVPSPTQSLEWHVWSSSSGNNCHAIQRSLSSGASVCDCTAGFYLVPYCQSSPPTRFLPTTAIGMCHFRWVWNIMFGRVEGQHTTFRGLIDWLIWARRFCCTLFCGDLAFALSLASIWLARGNFSRPGWLTRAGFLIYMYE